MYTVYGIKYTNANRIIYIGTTSGKLYDRKKVHRYKAKSGHYKTLLYEFMNKCGIDNFEFIKLDETKTKEEANHLENKYINKYDTLRNGMNTRKGGYSGYENNYTIKQFGKKVLCYEYATNKFIGEFDSVNEMTEKLKLCRAHVQDVLYKRRKSHKGFTFAFKEEIV